MVSKITTPPSQVDLVDKVNEIIDDKQDTLTAGDGIDITNNIISADNIVWVTYNTDTYATITTAMNANKVVLCKYNNMVFQCVRLYDGTMWIFTSPDNYNHTCYLFLTSANVWSYGGQTNVSTSAIVQSVADYSTSTNKIPSTKAVYDALPTVNNATLTITQGGTTKGTFTANASSNVTIDLDAGGGSVDVDNKSITTNSSDEIQTVGVIDSRDSSTAIKTWTGTRQQYDAIVSKDANTLYNVTDSIPVEEELQLSNPFSLLDYKFSEYEISNASWLRSNGQYNSGATYADVYNLLLQIKNGTVTKAGVSVKLSTETYADTDFVLNTSDTTFRLPLKVALASGKAVVGNGVTIGLTDGTNNAAISLTSNPYLTDNNSYGQNVGSSASGHPLSAGKSLGITTDPTKSGIETSANGLYLYFYVGAVVQDASVIAAASVLTQIAELLSFDYVVESKAPTANDPSWYRVYKSGWVEQGGFVDNIPAGTTGSGVVFLKEFSNTNYFSVPSWGPASYAAFGVNNRTTTGMTIYNRTNETTWCYWEAKGQGA